MQLISFLGYALFMIYPIQTFFEFAQKLTRATVSARKAIAIFEQQPPWREAADPEQLPDHGDLVDEETGFVAHEGELTIVVSAVPEDTSALADRLGRYLPTDTEPVSHDIGEGLKGRAARRARAEREVERARIAKRDEERAGQPVGRHPRRASTSRRPAWPTYAAGSWSATPAASCSPARSRTPSTPTAASTATRPRRRCASPTPRTSTTRCPAAGRASSTSAVAGSPEVSASGSCWPARSRPTRRVLVLVEPTSAVDAHTEARIAERVADVRRGRTTVVTTVSPLWLHHADRVVLVQDNRAIAAGTHEDLLLDSPDYRRVVTRAMNADDVPTESERR